MIVAALFAVTVPAFSQGVRATQSNYPAGYIAGCATAQTITVTNSFEYPASNTLVALYLTNELPAGWMLSTNTWGDGNCDVSTNSNEIVFTGTLPSNNPVVFSYQVIVPTNQSGVKALNAVVGYRFAGDSDVSEIAAEPNPLPIKMQLTITANSTNKNYGAELVFNGTEFTSQGLFGGDSVTNVTLASIGAGASATQGVYAITAANALGIGLTNYAVTYVDGTLTVGQRPVILAGARAYDGTTTATNTILTVTNTNGTGEVTVTLGSAWIAGKNVGVQPITNMGDLVLGGAQASNYTLIGGSGSVTITSRSITVTAVNNVKVYDGTTSATGQPTITSGSLVGSDTASWAEAYTNKDVGTGKTLMPSGSVNDGNGGTNYNVAFVPVYTGAITAKALAITANNTNKVYGSTHAFAGTEFTAVGLTNSDTITNVTLSSVGASASATQGVYAITGTNAQGAGLFNYNINYIDGALTVAPRSVILIGSRAYDGTVVAQFGILSVSNKVGSDDVTVASGSATLAGSNVGSRAISAMGSLALSGTQSANYTLTGASGSVTITGAVLTISGSFAVADKVYDGTTAATITQNSLTMLGLIAGDVGRVALNPVAAFANASAGTHTVSLTVATTISGPASGDYALSLVGAPTTTATIIQKSNQTIAFPQIADQVWTNILVLTASASSGLPVTFRVGAGPAEINGTALSFTGTGTVSIVASQSGNATWNPAPDVINTFKAIGVPVMGVLNCDFDGDRIADPAVYDANSGTWKVMLSSAGYYKVTAANLLGWLGWTSCAADYDGDGIADPGVYDESTGNWAVRLSSAGYVTIVVPKLMGGPGWTAIAADYDNDKIADPAVYQESTRNWKVKLSTAGYWEISLNNFMGGPGYSVISADYDGDGKADPAVYKQDDGTWIVRLSSAGYAPITLGFRLGGNGWNAVPGDYDGDRLADPAVRDASGTGEWRIMLSSANYLMLPLQLGL